MVSILQAWGFEVTLGFAGCYLIVSAIVGQLVRVRGQIPGIRLRSIPQRVSLGCFGLILAGPLLWVTYGKLVFGTPGSVFTPVIEDKIIVSPENSSEIAPTHFNVSWLQPSDHLCPVVETFGLGQRGIRQLQSAYFQKQVYVYASDIHSLPKKPFNVWVFVDRASWPSSGKLSEESFRQRSSAIPPRNIFPLEVRQKGQAIAFQYGGQAYRLTVTQIYAVLIGQDKIAVEICKPSGGANPEKRL